MFVKNRKETIDTMPKVSKRKD